MSKNKQVNDQRAKEIEVDSIFRTNVHNVIPVDLEDEMKSAFIDYAMSVITDRALPDIRDGLKPVHRRILYSMFTQGFTPDKAFRKCATTVGDVLGRFHPHGDIAVYDTMVRLAQDFSMRHMLVDGHGNFGSRDGDAAAAYRYTEARLTKISMEMMRDINKNTVDFQPNFDEHEMEPQVLPARFPNLLVNGSTGIAVGMATNIPPHNLGETIDASIHLMKHPETSIDELMTFIKAPDFPTGGIIQGLQGVRDFYHTGKGRVVVRGDAEIEEQGGGRHRIVIHDLPYMVNKAKLIESISQLVKDKVIDGISNLRDESDRSEAVRIVVELKRDANPNVVLNQLYRHSKLQDTFSANMLALQPQAQGYSVPKVVNLKETLFSYIEHQKEVVRRKTRFELEKAEARKHILEGLLVAIDHIDEVIAIIRASHTEDEAKKTLSERFDFSERQAQHIVDMRLGRLTGLERDKLLNDFKELLLKIEALLNILRDENLLISVIESDLLEIKKRYANERRSLIDPFGIDAIEDEALIQEESIVITLSHYGYIKRQPVDTYQIQHRGGRGISGVQTKDEDFIQNMVSTSTHDLILFFTNTGRIFTKKGYQIPQAGRLARGQAVINLLSLESGEKIVDLIPIQSFEQGGSLILTTVSGLVKRTELIAYKNVNKSGIIAISLRDDDKLLGAKLCQDDSELILTSKEGMLIRFEVSDIRETGRNTQGVKGMSLREGDCLVGVERVDTDNTSLLLVTENGFGKRVLFDAFRLQKRAGIGLRAYKLTEKTGKLVAVRKIREDQDLILINDAGIIIRLKASEVNIYGRTASGVTLMRTTDETRLVDLAVVDSDSDENANNDKDTENQEAVNDEVGSDLSDLELESNDLETQGLHIETSTGIDET